MRQSFSGLLMFHLTLLTAAAVSATSAAMCPAG